MKRLVILVHPQILPKLRAPDSWHRGLLEIITEQEVSEVGRLTDIEPSADGVFFAADSSQPSMVCFEEAVLPAFLKARFFVSAPEATKETETTVDVPLSATRFRSKVYRWLGVKSPMLNNKLVYMARSGRRAFTGSSEDLFLVTLRRFCGDMRLELEVARFDGMPLRDQISFMYDASLAVGIHGANLVNAIFMPAKAGLVEIFPHGFRHDMYVDGANSGLWYASYEIENGEEYVHLDRFNGSRSRCIHFDSKCKLFYRGDYRPLTFSSEDARGLYETLHNTLSRVRSLS